MTVSTQRWTIQDLETLPDDGGWTRYEIIDGELHVTRAPHFRHQGAGGKLYTRLDIWSEETGLGEVCQTPGVIFTDTDAVIPDLVWGHHERIAKGLDEAGHFILAPELIVEVLSPDERNVKRDKEIKLRLYSRHGVEEYWIVSWQLKTIEVYRRKDNQLQFVKILGMTDTLTSPLLPGCRVDVARIFP